MPEKMKKNGLPRQAGVLLPVSSLPSPYGIGTLGKAAFRFVDFLKRAGQSCWQVLPLGPTSYGDSPYQSFSAFAGNPYFIDLDLLIEEGLLTKQEVSSVDWGGEETCVDYEKLYLSRFAVLKKAFFNSSHGKTARYRSFCRENKDWLEDYCLYMALKTRLDGREWLLWPEELRLRRPEALARSAKELKEEIDFWKFCQYQFYGQWKKLKDYANGQGISIVGDIPIYVSLDSADVWAHGGLFQLGEDRGPSAVAGVPPDDFSATGQLWGNPLYDWDAMEQDGFAWWKRRMGFSAQIYDVIRIDHFIGIVRYYAIPAGSETAENGRWCKGPGKKLTNAIDAAVGGVQIIAEDLGVSVPEVRRLLKQTDYPGMKILQFGFNSGPENSHLPHRYTSNLAVYPGTHDNETLVGRLEHMTKQEEKYARRYLHVHQKSELPKAMIRACCASVANTFLCQMQDYLLLPNSARMNFPSILGGNWQWRLKEEALTPRLAKKMYRLAADYGRLPKMEETAKPGRG